MRVSRFSLSRALWSGWRGGGGCVLPARAARLVTLSLALFNVEGEGEPFFGRG